MATTEVTTPAVRFEHVTMKRNRLTILDDVSAIVPRGSCTAIVGPNGAGKTSLIMALVGEKAHQGAIILEPNAQGRCPVLGFVPQRLHTDRGLPLTVTEFLVMGIQSRPLWLGIRPECREQAHTLLGMVRAEHLHSRRLGELSGGELQRILLALALQQNPDILVLDEPSAGVDFQGEHLFCELLEELREKQGFTQLMVSHDLGMVAHHATHVICLNRKLVAAGAPSLLLDASVLKALFGLHMGIPEYSLAAHGHAHA